MENQIETIETTKIIHPRGESRDQGIGYLSDKEPQAYQYLALGVYQQMKAKQGGGTGVGMSLCTFDSRTSYLLFVLNSLIGGLH